METEVYRSVAGVQRGCGYRQEGGVYLESGLGLGGVPLEHFILDEPMPMKLDLKLGAQLWTDPNTKVTHIVDWVGAKNYPYACDVIEEGRRYGFSRRISPKIKWEELDERSRIILVHERGRLVNVNPFCFELDVHKEQHKQLCSLYKRESMKSQADMFPRMRDHINSPCKHSCNAYQYTTCKPTRVEFIPFDSGQKPVVWDQYVKGTTPFAVKMDVDRIIGKRQGTYKEWRYFRQIGTTLYRVYPNWALERPDEKWAFPQFEAAAIAAIPITNISVIRAADGEKHKATYAGIRSRLSPLLNVEVNEQ